MLHACCTHIVRVLHACCTRHGAWRVVRRRYSGAGCALIVGSGLLHVATTVRLSQFRRLPAGDAAADADQGGLGGGTELSLQVGQRGLRHVRLADEPELELEHDAAVA